MWPLVVLGGLIVFRREIKLLMSRVRSAGGFGIKVELDAAQGQLEKAQQALVTESGTSGQQMEEALIALKSASEHLSFAQADIGRRGAMMRRLRGLPGDRP